MPGILVLVMYNNGPELNELAPIVAHSMQHAKAARQLLASCIETLMLAGCRLHFLSACIADVSQG